MAKSKKEEVVIDGVVNGDASVTVDTETVKVIPVYTNPQTGSVETPQQAFANLKADSESARAISYRMYLRLAYFFNNKEAMRAVEIVYYGDDGERKTRKCRGWADLYTTLHISKSYASKAANISQHPWIAAQFEKLGIAKCDAIRVEADKAGPDAVAEWDKDEIVAFAEQKGNGASKIKAMLREAREDEMTDEDRFLNQATKVANMRESLAKAEALLLELAEVTGQDAEGQVRSILAEKAAKKQQKESKNA